LPEVFACHPQLQERSRDWKPLTDTVTTSPLVFREPQPERDGILMVGDAAAFVDPFVGDGISLALRSGRMAGNSLMPFFARITSLPDAARNYRATYEERLVPVFRTSSKIRRMLRLPQAVRIPILRFLEKSPAITRYMVRKTVKSSSPDVIPQKTRLTYVTGAGRMDCYHHAEAWGGRLEKIILILNGYFVVLLIGLSAAQQPAPQTARQALLEMFFSKTPGTFEKHLPQATRTALPKAGTYPPFLSGFSC